VEVILAMALRHLAQHSPFLATHLVTVGLQTQTVAVFKQTVNHLQEISNRLQIQEDSPQLELHLPRVLFHNLQIKIHRNLLQEVEQIAKERQPLLGCQTLVWAMQWKCSDLSERKPQRSRPLSLSASGTDMTI